MRVSPVWSQRRGWMDFGGRGKLLFQILQKNREQGRRHYNLQSKTYVGCTSEDSSQMAVESPCCLHDENLNHSSRTSTVVCRLRTTHCRGKPIKVIQNCDQSITDWCRWRRKGRGGRNLWDFSTHPISLTCTHKQPFKYKYILLTMENKHHTTSHTEKHSLCSGMNKALHTWNFLRHHATLHYWCSPLGELYPFFFLSVKHR